MTSRSAAQRTELTELQNRLEAVVAPALDDQFFYTVTGYRTLGVPPAPRAEHLSEHEFVRSRLLADLDASIGMAFQVLASAFRVSEASSLEPLRERFESAVGRVERTLATLEESPVSAALVPAVARLSALGLDEQNGFDLRSRELRLAAEQRELLARNRDLAVDLVVVVDALVSSARARTQEASLTSTGAIQTARSLLVVISVVSIGGAGVVAWLFVGRVLLRRLGMLSHSMRGMAGGDLDVPVEIGGRDEIADMAAALEVFRRRSREAESLQAIERLAEAVQEKNEELQHALEKLRRAQEQIVAQEKLAALGELTAGVAHEIRNPLNFVKNFSEVSGELLEDLREVLDREGGKLDAKQRELVGEITGDLRDNFERIRSHGDRANRIVHDMLMLGRGSAETQQTNLNGLLEEYAKLAFQSARMANPDCPLDLRFDLDPSGGRAGGRSAGPRPRVSEHGEQRLRRHRGEAPGRDNRGRTLCAHPADQQQAARGDDRDPHQGQRGRDTARDRRQDIRPVLHDQARRQGHGARPRVVRGHRARARRHHPGRDGTRRVHRDDHRAACLASGRG